MRKKDEEEEGAGQRKWRRRKRAFWISWHRGGAQFKVCSLSNFAEPAAVLGALPALPLLRIFDHPSDVFPTPR